VIEDFHSEDKEVSAMKKKLLFALLFAELFVGVCGASYAAQGGGNEAGMKEVHDFLKSCGNYYIATMEGDQPRVRPFSSLAIYEGKLYIQTGKVKDVSKQMAANPKIEICAFDGKDSWVRIQAIAVDDPRREPKQYLIDLQPGLEKMYSADDNNTQVLYLKDAVARYYSFSEPGGPRTIEF
jgi:uncharacterized pyridoxamine 5'-phosphate oxidase family protein